MSFLLGSGCPYGTNDEVAFVDEPVVKLPGGVSARLSAGLPETFVVLGAFGLRHQLRLHGTAHVPAELTPLILDTSVESHCVPLVLKIGALGQSLVGARVAVVKGKLAGESPSTLPWG